MCVYFRNADKETLSVKSNERILFQKQIRRHLAAAVNKGSLKELEEALRMCEQYDVQPDSEYFKAIRKVEYLRIKEGEALVPQARDATVGHGNGAAILTISNLFSHRGIHFLLNVEW